ncbi:MAG TPA: hypothetical protein PKC85_08340 [Bacteroidia bacterium]|jgi:hypothetical protein|nr:hypothetical protein [Bacteroidia bacterium]HMU19847.1 hypothetical protein [Bacteroidia bacterium]
MKKLVKRLSVLSAMLIISTVAFSQSTTTPETEQTTPPPTETTESTEDSTAATEEAIPDSTAVAPEGDAAAGAANEKPATRHKLYSGKQRGNNVIYDPKK